MPCSLQELPSGSDGHGRGVSISPYPHFPFLLVGALHTSLFHACNFGLSLFLGPSITLAYIFYTNPSIFFHSKLPKNLKVNLLIHSTTSHFTPIAQVSIPYLSYTLSWLSPSCHVIYSSQITHFHSCALFHVQVSNP